MRHLPGQTGNASERESKSDPTVGQGLVDQLARVVDDIWQNPHTLVAKLEGFLQHVKSSKSDQTSAASAAERPGSWANVVKRNDHTKKGADKRSPHVVNLARQCCWGSYEET